ncbi:fimbrial protein [Utexia brackfieldae]|uniref:fimbrial protein n=1 Tax=Utexia brackfieldae TaxID=3074108 RepID=UPI00370D00E0
MNKRNRFLVFIVLSSLSLSTYAYDVAITVNGRLTNQSCDVNSDSLSQSIVFDDISSGSMSKIGNVTDSKKVTINLDCYLTVNQLSFMFSGQADNTDSTLLKVTGSGTDEVAKGLAVEVLKESIRQRYNLNVKTAYGSGITGSTYAFDFYVRYRTVSLPVTAGDASAVLFLDMYYE